METFQLSEKLLKKIADLISAKKNTPLKKIVKDIHFADMAEIINELNEQQGIYLINYLIAKRLQKFLLNLMRMLEKKY